MMRKIATAGVLLVGLNTGPALADGWDYVSISAGAFDIDRFARDDLSAEGRIEFHSGHRLFSDELGGYFRGLGPMLGLMANADGGIFGYGGVYAEFRLFERLAVLPSAGMGGYHRGSSKDLGGVFQFHLGITGAYQLDNGSRVGITFAHISNARVHRNNPGVNSLLLTYSIPVATMF